jgi:hypothetical protein
MDHSFNIRRTRVEEVTENFDSLYLGRTVKEYEETFKEYGAEERTRLCISPLERLSVPSSVKLK